VESLKDYVGIVLNENRLTTKDKISEFERKLPDYFLRIHRSFIVNTKKITAFTTSDVEIEDKELPIGISYKPAVVKRLNEM